MEESKSAVLRKKTEKKMDEFQREMWVMDLARRKSQKTRSRGKVLRATKTSESGWARIS